MKRDYKVEDKKWMKFYNALCVYYKENNTVRDIDMNYKTKDGIELGLWLYKQLRLHNSGKLSQDKFNMLNKFDIEWDYLKSTVETLYKDIEDYFTNDKSLEEDKSISLKCNRLISIINNNERFSYMKDMLHNLLITKSTKYGANLIFTFDDKVISEETIDTNSLRIQYNS